MNRILKYLICGLVLSVVLPLKIVDAQTCGFGCLGLSGVYGGYTYQQYNAKGLNNYIQSIQNLESRLPGLYSNFKEFKDAQGFRVGANLIRLDYKNFIFSFKGSYQFLVSEQSFSETSGQFENSISTSIKLDYWSVGVDFGYSVSSFLDLKFADVQVTFHSSKLNFSSILEGITSETEYKTDKSITGYFVGSGFILNFVKNYLSLEATAGYTNFRIKELKDDKDNSFPFGTDKDDFIKSGGLTIIGQLNIGIPLY